jgi:histidinol dehydrogenase
MGLETGSVKNHRGREKGSLIYPVFSRRSRGLSIGVNLFPSGKVCNYDCPYCEVFPFASETVFSVEQMEEELLISIADFSKQTEPIRDICFSGNGEPSLSPLFPTALEKALRIRDTLIPSTAVVLITNGTGLLDDAVYNLLEEKSKVGLSIWLKIDAGTEDWFNKINSPLNLGPSGQQMPPCQQTQQQSSGFEKLITRIKSFVCASPCIIQTMICKVDGLPPPLCEEQAWLTLIGDIARQGSLKGVHIYGKARPGPKDPLAQALDTAVLENRANALSGALREAACTVPVEVFP